MKSLILLVLTSCGAFAQEHTDREMIAGKAISGMYSDASGMHEIPQQGPFVIDISASWCGSCNDEAKSWSAYLGTKAPKIPVLTLMFGQTLEDATSFKSRYHASWSFGIDDHKLFEKYCNGLLPCNLVIVDGIIKIQKDGELDISSAEQFTGKWK